MNAISFSLHYTARDSLPPTPLHLGQHGQLLSEGFTGGLAVLDLWLFGCGDIHASNQAAIATVCSFGIATAKCDCLNENSISMDI